MLYFVPIFGFLLYLVPCRDYHKSKTDHSVEIFTEGELFPSTILKERAAAGVEVRVFCDGMGDYFITPTIIFRVFLRY